MQCKAVSIVLIIFLLHIYARNVLSLFFSSSSHPFSKAFPYAEQKVVYFGD